MVKEVGRQCSLLWFLANSRQALVQATLNPKYRAIIESTCLLVFFATPHQGGNHASVGDIVAKIFSASFGKASNDLLEALKENSNDANRRFEQARHLPEKCLVISFFEGEPYGRFGIVGQAAYLSGELANCR